MLQRKQFGTAVADFGGIQHQYAAAAVDLETTRLLVYTAARRKMAGLPFVKEAAMAKLHASQVAERTASRAIEWCGGVGFTKDMPLEKVRTEGAGGGAGLGLHRATCALRRLTDEPTVHVRLQFYRDAKIGAIYEVRFTYLLYFDDAAGN